MNRWLGGYHLNCDGRRGDGRAVLSGMRCSLQGCGSSRCKSGRGKLTICPRSHVRRSFEVTHGNESSNVKVLVGEGQATVRAAASSELHSLVRAPTCTDSSGITADAEPLAFGRRLSRADVQSSWAARSAGVRKAALRQASLGEEDEM